MISPATRQKVNIDDDSWINQLTPPGGSIVLFIHGTFGDATETWGSTPDALLTTPALALFDLGSFGYSSKVFDSRTPEKFVAKLRLWINTHLDAYSDIYVVAHSMGGLLIRSAVCAMLNEADNNQVVKRIRICFLVASPVTGSSTATFLSAFGLSRFHSRLKFLDDPRFDGMPLGEAYATAARSYIQKGGDEIDVPRFAVFAGESDQIVDTPGKSFFTKYDSDEGVLPGDHGSIKLNKDVNSSLLTRVSQLILNSAGKSKRVQASRIKAIQTSTREREEATLASNARAVASVPKGAIDVLLISCSNTKSDAPGCHFSDGESLLDQLDNAEIRELAFATRSRMLTSIQKGHIDGIEFSEGNRSAKLINRQLVFGRDFGGRLSDPIYLPAYSRYRGRSYQAGQDEWESFLKLPKRPVVLVMSGLYGLLLATDSIQNYDTHLTDVDLSSGVSIQSYWKDRELMTELLLSHIKWLEAIVGPVGRVVDALSELSYQETINWSLVRHRWPVFHRVFERSAGREALANLGVWIRDVIRHPKLLSDIEPDRFYDNPSFVTPDRIAFEHIIGETSLKVMRQVGK